MTTLFAIVKITLIIFSAILFDRCYVPPIGNPEISLPPPLKSSFFVKREWFLNCIVVYYFPVQRMAYLAITLYELKFIITQLHTSPDLLSNSTHTISTSLYPWLPLIGLIIAIAGGLIRLSCYRALGKDFSFNVLVTESPSDKLVTSGPYSLIRHPSYTGIIALSAGLIMYFLSPGSWIRESGLLDHPLGRTVIYVWVVVVNYVNVMLIMRTPEEDRQLQRKFGEEWEEWEMNVRSKLVPGVY
ncbi:hypothetical protein E1B28_005273 [Marasmius oreades]|uniref:Protein-S-isoprenylcysteine O-methyltransferase n=1 Tax=Marasmius oreades TaxID=181124 RepID=A0A9P8ADU6_9AGAR|nr:uncharacterized protein E1B28_005273 [Marasmius oreades]KAG7097962.1 hypothetical protein E1B28_005273 [Marasmius oreades]